MMITQINESSVFYVCAMYLAFLLTLWTFIMDIAYIDKLVERFRYSIQQKQAA